MRRIFIFRVFRVLTNVTTGYPGNHSSVWGSHFSALSGLWGFACCHSSVKNSYCAGSAAIEAASSEANGGLALLTSRAEAEEQTKSMLQLKTEENAAADKKGKRKAVEEDDGGRKRVVGEGDIDKRLDKSKLEEVLSGKAKSYAGKQVTEEDMGKLFASSFILRSC